ncbi:hypothetical protein [Brevundimonas sp. SH203]|uniref:hypothetical protein n=1 Tax=Brevundimonas sp. SH203 TaxID=345167 RepID=UPI000B35A988|nr:hypothetical protein [Brevundimonas sp. SH203]
MAQESDWHWVCFSEVDASQGVGMRMTLLGPALRRNIVHNIYFTEFTTPASQRDQQTNYEIGYAAALTQAGYSGVSSASCAAFNSIAGAENRKAWLREPATGGGGSVRMTFNNIPVSWAPEVKAPAPSPTAQKNAPDTPAT